MAAVVRLSSYRRRASEGLFYDVLHAESTAVLPPLGCSKRPDHLGGATPLTKEALANIIDKLLQSREEQREAAAAAATGAQRRPAPRMSPSGGLAAFVGGEMPASPTSAAAASDDGSTGGGSVGGRNDTALWEEATAMLRGELIRLGREAAQKMEVGAGGKEGGGVAEGGERGSVAALPTPCVALCLPSTRFSSSDPRSPLIRPVITLHSSHSPPSCPTTGKRAAAQRGGRAQDGPLLGRGHGDAPGGDERPVHPGGWRGMLCMGICALLKKFMDLLGCSR